MLLPAATHTLANVNRQIFMQGKGEANEGEEEGRIRKTRKLPTPKLDKEKSVVNAQRKQIDVIR